MNWKFRILTAEARIRVGSYAQSLDVLQLEPPASLPQDIFLRRRMIQAYALCYLKDYAHAEDLLRQAEAIQTKIGANESDLDYFRGRCELNRGDEEKGEQYLRKALESAAPEDVPLKTNILLSLAYYTARDLRYEESIDWYTQALSAARALHAPLLEERALARRGLNYQVLFDFASAQKDLGEAEAITSRMKILSDEQSWLTGIGLNQVHLGQYGAAEESYKRALAIATDLKDQDTTTICLLNLINIKLHENDLAAAEKYYAMTVKLEMQGENLWYLQLYKAKIAARHEDYATAVHGLQGLLQQIENETRSNKNTFYPIKWDAESSLAQAYAAQNNAKAAENWFQQGIDTVERAVHATPDNGYRIRDNLPIFDDYVTFLIRQGQPEKALQVAQLGRGRSLRPATQQSVESPRQWLARAQHALRAKNVVLLSYFATTSGCYLWVVTPARMQPFIIAIAGPDLDNLVGSYRKEIQDHLPLASSPAAKKLFQVLVQPALQLVPKGSHVMVLADSSIYTLNFETLISPQSGDHYWIDDVDVQYASSIDLLLQPNHVSSPSRELLLIGAPIQASPEFPPLPHAPQEMESVRKHFTGSAMAEFLGKNATPESYTQNNPARFKYIHFATHGTANAVHPLQSAIILSSGKNGDFKLLAQQIAGPTLRINADLVTISACEGTGTQVQSLEGLLGLEWAFMRAGARQVVAALWDVDDTVTPGLMDDFYGALKKGETTAEALRHAKLKLLHSNSYYAAPYYWAPLQVYTRY